MSCKDDVPVSKLRRPAISSSRLLLLSCTSAQEAVSVRAWRGIKQAQCTHPLGQDPPSRAGAVLLGAWRSPTAARRRRRCAPPRWLSAVARRRLPGAATRMALRGVWRSPRCFRSKECSVQACAAQLQRATRQGYMLQQRRGACHDARNKAARERTHRVSSTARVVVLGCGERATRRAARPARRRRRRVGLLDGAGRRGRDSPQARHDVTLTERCARQNAQAERFQSALPYVRAALHCGDGRSLSFCV